MTDEFCVVETEYGKVRGAKIISDVDIPYWRFLGIPYAKPPVGNRRFQQASKPDLWDGILDALQEPPPCAGRNSILKKFVGTDDCLYLNIYTKNLKPDKPQPVIVYIHGGGFNSGSSTLSYYSPDYLLMHDVVIVIFNYRLGSLGFLSLKDKSLNVPGNAGMKDQLMVLEFVRDNIQNFGGDPNNVTLAGHSAGGAAVGLHCLSNSSKGLFQRAIILGIGPSQFIAGVHQLNWAKRLAVKLGFDEENNDEKEILKFLESTDVLEMAEAATALATPEEQKKYGVVFPFSPNSESYTNDSTFLSKDQIYDAWSKDMNILTGHVSFEGLGSRFLIKNDSTGAVPVDIILKVSQEKLEEIKQKVKSFYYSEFKDEIESVERMNGDMIMWLSMCRFIKFRLLNNGKGKTFLHKFGVDSSTQNNYRNRYFGPGSKGVVHADELCYLWKHEQVDVPPRDSMEFRAIETFTSIITNFAKTGDPGIPDWKPIDELPPKALTILADELKFEVPAESERIFNFWEKIYEEAGVKFC